MKKKQLLALILAITMMLTLAACGGTGGSAATSNAGAPGAGETGNAAGNAAPADAQTGGSNLLSAEDSGLADLIGGSRLVSDVSGQSDDAVLKIAFGGEPVNLDPWEARGAGYIPVLCNVYETLFKWDPAQNKYVGQLAESFEWTDDTTLTINLRHGVKFHSGNEMKAEDVLYTLKAVSEFIGGASRVEAIDFDKSHCDGDYTVVFVTKHHAPSLITQMSSQVTVIKEKAWVEAHGTEDSMNGTGAYKCTDWVKGVKLACERFDDYWNKDNVQSYYKYVESYFYNDMTTAFLDFEVGNLDIVKVESSTDLDNLLAGQYDNQAYYMKVFQNGIQMLCFYSPADERFDDVRVRQAFCEALDMATMVPALSGQVYDIASSTLPNSSWAYKDESSMITYNPEHAKELVKDLTAEGMSMEFTVPIEQRGNNLVLAEAMQAQLAEVGITLNIEPTQMSDFLPKMNAGQISIGFGGSSGGWDPIEAWFPVIPDSGSIAECLDEEAGKLMLEAADTDSTEERVKLYQQVQDILAENYRYLPIYCEPVWYAVSNSVANISFGLDHYIFWADVAPAQ